ncbi:bifunctional diguanylate cyclase/phosphodiesterase [Oceanisphaera sp. DM8]|uniref:Bifunctional diguanylate cyclase/phosphodiesterase n=2 Tax=Oceanisphaera pacifica TaxID=2818389 RepID=A0ABS3NDH4_9GAMM|nr:bifunctional diguanylate cyclase/phosphodiesterase [Oceanisphaera pacifica]
MIIALLFSASSMYSYYRDLEVVRYVSATIKAVGWTSSELEMEVLKFDHALTALAAETADEEFVQLHFELLWSRINTLLQGEESRPVREQPGVLPILESLSIQLARWESRIYALGTSDSAGNKAKQRAQVMALRQELSHFRKLAREINVDSFSGTNAWQQLDIIQDIRLRSSVYLIGLLLSGGLMMLLLLRENRRNRYLAYHDILTRLPNRMYFYQLINKALRDADKRNAGLAVHMIDLNGFKAINDSLGHEVGDKLLTVVAQRLQECVKVHGHAARLGGDEFVVIQPLSLGEDPKPMATQLWQSLIRDVPLPAGNLSPQACIGTSVYPEQGTGVSELLSHADTAMYYAKHSSTVMVQCYEMGMDERRLRKQKLALALQGAIEQDQLVLYYQPIYELEGGAIESVEALLRWHSSEHGVIHPLEIIAVAEHHGLAHKLNEWVLLTASRQLSDWHQAGFSGLKVNVNISPSIFMDGELASTVHNVLRATALSASSLVLEITEDTSLWDTKGSIATLEQLRKLGVEIALDDFGTGYSSFSHLRQLPLNKLKIDKSFVADMTTDPKALSLVKTIIALAASLEMKVTAEGVELKEQQLQLQQLGCELGQGYLLAKPMAAIDMTAELQSTCA